MNVPSVSDQSGLAVGCNSLHCSISTDLNQSFLKMLTNPPSILNGEQLRLLPVAVVPVGYPAAVGGLGVIRKQFDELG
jgi:hypothetical protein